MQGNGTIYSPYLVDGIDNLISLQSISPSTSNEYVYVEQTVDLINTSSEPLRFEIDKRVIYNGNFYKMENILFSTVGDRSILKRLHVTNNIILNLSNRIQTNPVYGFIGTLKGALDDVHIKFNVSIVGPIKTMYQKYFANISGICNKITYYNQTEYQYEINNCTVVTNVNILRKNDLNSINIYGLVANIYRYDKELIRVNNSIIKLTSDGEYNNIYGVGAYNISNTAIYINCSSSVSDCNMYGCSSGSVVFNNSYIIGKLSNLAEGSNIYGVSDLDVNINSSYLRLEYDLLDDNNAYAITGDILNSNITDSFYSVTSWGKDDYEGRFKMTDEQLRNRMENYTDSLYNRFDITYDYKEIGWNSYYPPDDNLGDNMDVMITNMYYSGHPIVFFKFNDRWINIIEYNSNMSLLLGKDSLHYTQSVHGNILYGDKNDASKVNYLTSYFIGTDFTGHVANTKVISSIDEATGLGFVYDCINNIQYFRFDENDNWEPLDRFISFTYPYYDSGIWYTPLEMPISDFGIDGDIMFVLPGIYERDLNNWQNDDILGTIPNTKFLEYYVWTKRNGIWINLTPYFSDGSWSNGDDDMYELRIKTILEHVGLYGYSTIHSVRTKCIEYYPNNGFPTLRKLKYNHVFKDMIKKDLPIRIKLEDNVEVGLKLKYAEAHDFVRIQTDEGIKTLI